MNNREDLTAKNAKGAKSGLLLKETTAYNGVDNGESLLIYSLAEKRIRGLASNEVTVWDQKNKPTQRPTIRWVFMIFEDVLLLYYENKTIEAMNIRTYQREFKKSVTF